VLRTCTVAKLAPEILNRLKIATHFYGDERDGLIFLGMGRFSAILSLWP